MEPALYVLTGTTAVGKTDLSLAWAKALNAEILSCDTTLFYKGMDIGTAKPSQDELSQIPHHGIDLCPVNEIYNIKSYLDYAIETIQDIHSRGKHVLIVGGSGFYLKAFFAPVVDDIEVPAALMDTVNAMIPADQLTQLKSLNPDGLGDLHLENPRRVSKALARCLTTGKSHLDLTKEFNALGTPFDSFKRHLTLLTRNDAHLKQRVIQRIDIMLQSGLIDEVKSLLDHGIIENPSAASAIGYRETIEHIQNNTPFEDYRSQVIINTNRLIAKQRKWFRNQVNPDQVLNLDEDPDLTVPAV